MKRALGRMLRRAAPGTADGLVDVAEVRARFGSLAGELDRARAEAEGLREELARANQQIDEMHQEIDELRRDAPRIAELYDLVFERLAERR